MSRFDDEMERAWREFNNEPRAGGCGGTRQGVIVTPITTTAWELPDNARLGKFEPATGMAGYVSDAFAFHSHTHIGGCDAMTSANLLMEADQNARPVLNSQLVQRRVDPVAAAREEGAASERARILAAVESVAPIEQPYSRRDWALEQRGARDHHAKVLKAIQEPAKPAKGE